MSDITLSQKSVYSKFPKLNIFPYFESIPYPSLTMKLNISFKNKNWVILQCLLKML